MPSARLRRTGARSALLTVSLALGAGALVIPTAGAASYAPTYSIDRTLKDSRINESSGLARSTRSSDILFTHNDSGDTNRVFAVDRSGNTKAVLTLSGAKARDWEDISSGPGNTIWVGDIGDNSTRRSNITVYKFTEPTSLSTGSVKATGYNLTYPDGPHNAEGLMVHPKTGRVYVVTKAKSGAGVYVAPSTLSTTANNRMTRVSNAPAMMSAATFSPDGSKFILSGYSRAYIYNGFGGSYDDVRKKAGESVEMTSNGTMLAGTEGRTSPVYKTALR